MPLDRDHVTAASRIMLPTYATVFGLLGLLFLLQDPQRTGGPAFGPARMLFEWLPIYAMRGWGIVFLSVASLEVLAWWVAHRRSWYLSGLTVGAGLVAFWTVILVAAGFEDPNVSFTSAVWVGGWIAAHAASAKSLRLGER